MKTAEDSAVCRCQHCDQKIKFNAANAGHTVACPNCGMETMLFIPAVEKKQTYNNPELSSLRSVQACPDCLDPISRRAIICPNCGGVPSLWRVGWFAFCVLGVIGLIDLLIFALFSALMRAFS